MKVGPKNQRKKEKKKRKWKHVSSFWTLKLVIANHERLFTFSYVCAPKYFLNK
jgi:hypothetical protein